MFKFTDKDNEENEIYLYEQPFCEHCYDLEPFEITIGIDIQYCIGCSNANGIEIPEKLLVEIETKQKELRIEYYKKKLKELG